MNGINRQFRRARMALVLAALVGSLTLSGETGAEEHGAENVAQNVAENVAQNAAQEPAGTQVEADSDIPTQEGGDAFRGSPPVSGSPESSPDRASEAFDVSYFSVMAKLGVALGFVVLLAWGTVYLLRKSRIGQQFGAAGGSIRVAERAYLGTKKQICLVEIGGRALVLGVTEENISLLAEWPADELDLPSPDETSGPFANQLRKLIGQMREPPVHQEPSRL